MQTGSDNVKERSAALQGASLAFAAAKPPTGPKPKAAPKKEVGIGNLNGQDGALAAATMAGTGSTRGDGNGNAMLGRQGTGGSVGGSSNFGDGRQRIGQSGLLQPPGLYTSVEGNRSTSFIAATLAASRSASVSPNPTGSSPAGILDFKRPNQMRTLSTRSGGSSSSDVVDAMPIPPTRGLIGLFEENTGQVKEVGRKPGIRAPPRSRSVISLRDKARARSPSPLGLRVETKKKGPKPEIKSPKPNLGPVSMRYFPPRPSTVMEASTTLKAQTTKPIPIATRPKTAPTQDDNSSDDSFVSASSQHTEPITSEYKLSFRAAIAEQRRRSRSVNNSRTSLASTTAREIDSMANAIVASSLASSRAASPAKHLTNMHPPLPPARRSGKTALGFGTKERTPSPMKQQTTGRSMRTTLRKVKSKDSLDERDKRTGKKNLVKKHPHKHHEGDRKRWRDAITERERKRYEALWASNRGLWLEGEVREEGRVCNFVVRDVWSRSRLGADVLEEVYGLVDRSAVGSLEREEFVVGLWLVDQWLRGRKLPVRVTGSVWRSVEGTGGIKIPKIKR